MRRAVIGLFTAVALGILFAVMCTFVRRPYETVILNRFGKLVLQQEQSRIAYNWYLKWPTDRVVRIDDRLHLYTSPLQQINTAGSTSISVQTYAAWRIVDAVKYYNGTGGSDERLQTFLGNALSSAVSQAVSGQQLEDIFNVNQALLKTPAMEAQIAEFATEGSKKQGLTGMRDLGVEIVQVGFSRMAFSPNNAISVYARMATEQDVKATGILQQGVADAERIKAEGRDTAAQITHDATIKAGQIRGQADAEAVSALAAVQQSPLARKFYRMWKSLDFLKNSLTKNTVYVLPTDSDLINNGFTAPKDTENGPAATQPAQASISPAAPAGH